MLSHTERAAISVKAVLQSVLSSVIVWQSCALAMDYLLLFVLVVPTSSVIPIKVTNSAGICITMFIIEAMQLVLRCTVGI